MSNNHLLNVVALVALLGGEGVSPQQLLDGSHLAHVQRLVSGCSVLVGQDYYAAKQVRHGQAGAAHDAHMGSICARAYVRAYVRAECASVNACACVCVRMCLMCHHHQPPALCHM